MGRINVDGPGILMLDEGPAVAAKWGGGLSLGANSRVVRRYPISALDRAGRGGERYWKDCSFSLFQRTTTSVCRRRPCGV